jgi:hypothetical protein
MVKERVLIFLTITTLMLFICQTGADYALIIMATIQISALAIHGWYDY